MLVGQLADQRGDVAGIGGCGSRGRRCLRGFCGRRLGLGASAFGASAAGCSAWAGSFTGASRSWAGAAATGSASFGSALAGPAPVPMMASTEPTSAVSSSATLISWTVPATGDGISVSTLSVETSSSGSSTSTVSPTCFSQRVTVPSVTLSPRAGRVTSVPSPEPAAGASSAGASCWGSSCFGASCAGASCCGSSAGASSAGASSAAWPEPEPSPMRTSGAPTSAVSSSATRISSITPATGEGTAAAGRGSGPVARPGYPGPAGAAAGQRGRGWRWTRKPRACCCPSRPGRPEGCCMRWPPRAWPGRCRRAGRRSPARLRQFYRLVIEKLEQD